MLVQLAGGRADGPDQLGSGAGSCSEMSVHGDDAVIVEQLLRSETAGASDDVRDVLVSTPSIPNASSEVD